MRPGWKAVGLVLRSHCDEQFRRDIARLPGCGMSQAPPGRTLCPWRLEEGDFFVIVVLPFGPCFIRYSEVGLFLVLFVGVRANKVENPRTLLLPEAQMGSL